MIKRKIFLITLILINSIALLGQTQASDSAKVCYTINEARVISSKLIDNKKNEALIKQVYEPTIKAQDSIIKSQERIILLQENRFSSCQRLVKEMDVEVARLTKELKKEARRKKWLKFGWISTTIIETALLIFVAIK